MYRKSWNKRMPFFKEGTYLTAGIFLLGLGILISLFFAEITFGTTLLMVLGAGLLIWYVLCRLSHREDLRKKVVFLRRCIFFLFIGWFFSFLIVEGLILSAVAPDYEEKVDYVLVLGAGLRGEIPSLTLHTRLKKSVEYLKDKPQLKVIVSGGQGPGESITEAEAMKRFLAANGIEEDRIIKEERSTSTLENLRFSKSILEETEGKKSFRIMIITSDFHMFRAKYLARKNGLIPYGIPSQTPLYLLLDYCVREYLAVIKSVILD